MSGPDRGNKGGLLQYTVGETFRLWFIMILQYIMILLYRPIVLLIFLFCFYQNHNVLRTPLTVLSNRQPISALNSNSPNSIMTSFEDKHCSLG